MKKFWSLLLVHLPCVGVLGLPFVGISTAWAGLSILTDALVVFTTLYLGYLWYHSIRRHDRTRMILWLATLFFVGTLPLHALIKDASGSPHCATGMTINYLYWYAFQRP